MSKKKVFISYTHDDDTWAKAFADALAKQGLSLWFDQWDIKPGEKISEAIDQALRDSESVVFLLHPESVDSPNLFFELGAAVAMRKKIIPIILQTLNGQKYPFLSCKCVILSVVRQIKPPKKWRRPSRDFQCHRTGTTPNAALLFAWCNSAVFDPIERAST